MNVRSSLYTRASKAHEHEYGPEIYNADDDEVTGPDLPLAEMKPHMCCKIVPHCLTLGFYNGSIVQMTDKIRLTEHSLYHTAKSLQS